MPKGNEHQPNYASMAQQWFVDDLEAKRRLERLMGRLEPLRKDWIEADLEYLKSWNIKPS